MEFVHIHRGQREGNLSFLLLFIPAVVFFLTLALLLSRYPKTQIATTSQESEVLGEESP